MISFKSAREVSSSVRNRNKKTRMASWAFLMHMSFVSTFLIKPMRVVVILHKRYSLLIYDTGSHQNILQSFFAQLTEQKTLLKG